MIQGFYGEFDNISDRLAPDRLAPYGPLEKAPAETSFVPYRLRLNERPDDSRVLGMVEAGFHLVIPAHPSHAYHAYGPRGKRIVSCAPVPQVAVKVELELGELARAVAVHGKHPGQFGDPHDFLGCRDPRDVLVGTRLAVRDAVLERNELLGSCGGAS
jgi:hypothetical protein